MASAAGAAAGIKVAGSPHMPPRTENDALLDAALAAPHAGLDFDDLGDLDGDNLTSALDIDDEELNDVNLLVASLLRNRDKLGGAAADPISTSSPLEGSDNGAARVNEPRDKAAFEPGGRQLGASQAQSHQRSAARDSGSSSLEVLPPVADDFIRNFMVRARMRRALDAFNSEWYELKARGALPDSDALELPDVYAQNEALHDEIERLRLEVGHAHEVAAKAQATWDRFRRERDMHRLHHKRVLNEKQALTVDLRRLRAHHERMAPLVGELRAKTEVALREKALARLERDRALARAAALEAALASGRGGSAFDAASSPSSGTGGGGGAPLMSASAVAAGRGHAGGAGGGPTLDRSASASSILAGRRAAAHAGATGGHWQLRQQPTLTSPGAATVQPTGEDVTAGSSSLPSSSTLVGHGGPSLNPQLRLSEPGGLAGRAIERSVHRAAAQATALAAEARLPADDQTNPFLKVAFEPARAGRYGPASVRTFAAHDAPIAGLSFHPSKPVLATASDDRTWRIWAFREPSRPPRAAAGASGGGAGARVGRCGGMSRSATALGLPTPTHTAGAAILEAQAARRLVLPPGLGREDTLGLDSNGDTACGGDSPDDDGRDSEDEQQRPFHHSRGDDDGTDAATVGGSASLPDVLEGDSELIMAGTGHKSWLSDVAFSPAGGTLATASGDGVVKLWSLASSKCVHTLTEHSQAAWGVAWNTVGDFLATASMDQCARVWDVATGKHKVALRGHVDAVNAVVWQPFSANVITASADKTVSVWDCRSGQCVQTFFGHTNAVTDVAVALRGDVVASSDSDGWVRLWDLRMVTQWAAGHLDATGPVHALAFDRSGTVLAAGCDDGAVRLVGLPPAAGMPTPLHGADPCDGEEREGVPSGGMHPVRLLASLHGHSQSVQAVAFDPTSSYLASAGNDGTVRLWAEKGCK